jgi:hypothetical protein
MLALTPLLLIVIALITRGALAPVRRLTAIVDGQDEVTLDALSEAGIPKELLPFIRSIDRLISRLKDAMAQQRRFIADAAHELRLQRGIRRRIFVDRRKYVSVFLVDGPVWPAALSITSRRYCRPGTNMPA